MVDGAWNDLCSIGYILKLWKMLCYVWIKCMFCFIGKLLYHGLEVPSIIMAVVTKFKVHIIVKFEFLSSKAGKVL